MQRCVMRQVLYGWLSNWWCEVVSLATGLCFLEFVLFVTIVQSSGRNTCRQRHQQNQKNLRIHMYLVLWVACVERKSDWRSWGPATFDGNLPRPVLHRSWGKIGLTQRDSLRSSSQRHQTDSKRIDSSVIQLRWCKAYWLCQNRLLGRWVRILPG